MSSTHDAQTFNQKGKGHSYQPAGHLLEGIGLALMLVILVLAAWFGQTMVAIIASLVLSAAGLTKLWSRFSLVGVHCQRIISEQRLFPGEYTELRLRLLNRKPLPLPWIQVDDEIPYRLTPDISLTPGDRPGCGIMSHGASMLWYTGLNWRYRLCCKKRGYYSLGPLTVTSGDIFGFYPRSSTQTAIDHIIVYPKIFPLTQLGLPSLYPLGETRAERRIFEDPTRTIGVRDYTPHDSFKNIHWKASARQQKLQVKIFEPTTTLKASLFLAVDSFQYSDGTDSEEDFELGISTAASLANYIMQQRSPVGLYVNTRLPDSDQPIRIPPGSNTSQLVNILEALAKVRLLPSSPFDEFLRGERGNLQWGNTLIFIVSKPLDSLPGLLLGLKEAGYKTIVLQTGKQKMAKLNQTMEWYNITRPGNLIEFSSKEIK